jgi:hypothetical protein
VVVVAVMMGTGVEYQRALLGHGLVVYAGSDRRGLLGGWPGSILPLLREQVTGSLGFRAVGC